MIAGKLTEQIRIYEPVTVRSEYGSEDIEYTLIKTTKAEVKYLSGNRVKTEFEYYNDYSVSFTIRSYHKVSYDYVIEYSDNKYRILSIEPNKLHNLINIITELIND